MKTAMQELIELLEKKLKNVMSLKFSSEQDYNRISGKIEGLKIAISDCKYELAKERQQIIDAVDKGQIYNDGFVYENGEQYYNQTYNNEADKQQNNP